MSHERKSWKSSKNAHFWKQFLINETAVCHTAEQFDYLIPNLYYIFYPFNVTELLIASKAILRISKNLSKIIDLRWPSFRQIHRETVLLSELNGLTYAFCSTSHIDRYEFDNCLVFKVKIIRYFEATIAVVLGIDDLAVVLGVLGRVGWGRRHLVYGVSPLSDPYQFLFWPGQISPLNKNWLSIPSN